MNRLLDFFDDAPIPLVLAAVILFSALLGTLLVDSRLLWQFVSKSIIDITVGDLILLYMFFRVASWFARDAG